MLSRSRAQMNALFFFLTLVMSLVTGCATEESYVPRYPGARMMNDKQMTYTIDHPKAKISVQMFDSVDDISEVAAFYEGQLAGRPGWTGGWTRGNEFGQWQDGNVKCLNRQMTKWEPVDASKPGGYVFLAKKEGGCVIQVVTSTPK